VAKDLQFSARMSKTQKDDCDVLKANIKLISLPTKITDGEIVEQGLELLLKKVKKGE